MLNKKFVFYFIFIITILFFNNISYANNSIIGTKDRIKEIKIFKEIDITKLGRKNEEIKIKFYKREKTSVSRDEKTRENKVIEQKYKSIGEIQISKNMDLTIRTGISKEDFKLLMSNIKQDSSKFFYENSDLIYDLCEKYQINEIFFCGLISAESGWNIANNHRITHNYISLMSKGKLIRYSSKEEGLEVAARMLHKNYLTPGGCYYKGKTLDGVHKYFCPSDTWVNLVYGRMNHIMDAVNRLK